MIIFWRFILQLKKKSSYFIFYQLKKIKQSQLSDLQRKTLFYYAILYFTLQISIFFSNTHTQLLRVQEFKMGNDFCCTQYTPQKSKTKIVTSKGKLQDLKLRHTAFVQSSSTSDSDTQQIYYPPQKSVPQKSISFQKYIRQREFQISSIKKIQQSFEDCSQQKIIINQLERNQKEINRIRLENDPSLHEQLIHREQLYKIDERKLIQHACKCLICFQMLQNLKNMEGQETALASIQQENRISLQDNILESQQCKKAKRCAQCKCEVFSSHQWADRAMRKFPNTNKYQSKRLKFRKTSLFEPQIKQQRQSQESNESIQAHKVKN